ncbi:MAG: carbohydrate-binding domain-containing protein [Erysipelotrichaceae bacterium]|nr:carbohydrate-binding domain-containing protein [Erysipelotrichaceae bacterium]
MKKLLILFITVLLLSGCSTVISDNKTASDGEAANYNMSFTESETDSSYSINGSTYVTLGDDDLNIRKGGTYILEGTLNGSIIIEVSEKEDVQLVLNNVTINSGDFAGIYIIEGDEITITLAEGSENTIVDSGEYVQIDDNDVDALIYSKADLIINGSGTLNLGSKYNHGIVSKDDLVITGGNFNIDVAGQGLRGKDCVKILDGTFNISSDKDAIKSDNDEDEYRGYVYITGGTFSIDSKADGIYGYNLVNIEGGTFDIKTSTSADADSYKAIKSDYSITISGGSFIINSTDDGLNSNNDLYISGGEFDITSSDDAIHGDATVTIDDGEFTINAAEGIESTYVTINGGNISINASDDGINAGQKVETYTPTVEINGGNLTIVMGQGDTDGIDANGNIYVNGGTVNITGQFAFDFDNVAEHNGGTIIVNGEEIDEITGQMMGGGMQGMGGMNPGGMNPGGFGHGH